MSARSDYLTLLTLAGFTPNRAVLFEEAIGIPAEFYTAAAMSVSGSPTWATDITYGASFFDSNVNYNQSLPDSNWVGTTKQTVLVIRRKTDTTLRSQLTFAIQTAGGADRCGAHLPWVDGNVYFDFGGAVAPNRLTYGGYVPSTNLEAWAFRAGTLGSSIWKNGVQVASQATALTRTGSTVEDFNTNAGFLVSGDLQEFYFICWVPDEVSDAVLATFTIDNVLLGAPAPSIDTTSPLPDAVQDDPYTTTIVTSGGTGAISVTVDSGTVPDGWSLDPSTGVITGPFTSHGLFHFVIKATDELDHSVLKEFDLYVDDPNCTPENLGSLLRGQFANNSRVGPFQDGTKTMVGIFRDPDNVKRLYAQRSTNNGITWSTITATAVPNNIVSFDAHQVTDDAVIHVATQETNGRVAYFTFNIDSGLWVVSNEQVVASASTITGAVSMAVLQPSNDPVIVYESSKQNVAGTDYSRMTYIRRTAGTWGAPIPIGDIGAAQSDLFGRAVPGNEDRIRMIMAVSPGYFVPATPDFQLQIINGDGSLSAIHVFHFSGLLGNVPPFFMGDYCTYTDPTTGDLMMAVPTSLGGGSQYYLFIDSATPDDPVDSGTLANFVATGSFTAFVFRFAQSQIHSIDWMWSNLGADTWLRYKAGLPPTTPFAPAGTDDQCGPTLGLIGLATQTMDATIAARTCDDVTSLYVVTFTAIGTVDGTADTIKFEWLKVDDLPSDPALTLALWLEELPDQNVLFCCTPVPPPPPPPSEVCVHALHRTDEYAAQAYSPGWVQTPARPYQYSVSVTPPVQLQLIPAPAINGTLDLCTVNSGPALALDPNTPVQLGIPDDFAWAIKWGTLAQLLSSDGDVRDPVRAKYCQQMYDLAASLARTPVTTLMVQIDDVNIPTSAIDDLDKFQPEWQCASGRPSQAAMVGANLLVLAGDPSNSDTGVPDGIYGVTVDLARSFPVPDPALPTTTYLQVGSEVVNAILDMAQHICSFKMAGKEMEDTLALRQNFLRTCALINARLRSNAFYNLLLSQPASRQDDKVAKFVPRNPDEDNQA